MKPLLLIIDDEPHMVQSLYRKIIRLPIGTQMKVETAVGGRAGLQFLEEGRPKIILTDMRMPEVNGHDIIRKAAGSASRIYTIAMTGYADLKEAVSLLKEGVYDYISKPFEIEELESVLGRILHELDLETQIQELQSRISGISANTKQVISNDPKMEEIKQRISSVRDTDFNVLILGESGTGKELIADLLHYSCLRRNGPFIKVNCAGLVSSLLESEMFGHEKGAFTGAVKRKEGKFALANGGTLFLDEIGDMDIALQAKLLRTIQDGVYQRVGGEESLQTDARIIAATNRNLMNYIEEGKFRQDLYYRLNVINIELPPLRERRVDIPLLSMYFLKKLSEKYGKDIRSISKETIEFLETYPFPGNIRELENIITQAFVSASGETLLKSDLPKNVTAGVEPESQPSSAENEDLHLKRMLERVEKDHIRKVLELSGYNKTQATELLGISRRQLYYKINEYNL